MSDLIRNPDDRFSHNEAHISLIMRTADFWGELAIIESRDFTIDVTAYLHSQVFVFFIVCLIWFVLFVALSPC